MEQYYALQTDKKNNSGQHYCDGRSQTNDSIKMVPFYNTF